MQPASTPKPDIFDRLFWRFVASLQRSEPASTRAVIIAVAVVFLFAILLVLSPRMLVLDYTYDFFIPLDGALRSLDGQWPHLDFYTPVGDLYYFLLGLSAHLFGFTPKLVMWEQILVLPFAVGTMIFATRDRLPQSLRAILILMIGLLCISPSDLDDSASLSFLASYNRHGWVFMTPFLAAALLEPLHGRRRGWIGDAGLLFLLVMILFYLKITFALVAILTLVLAAIWVPQNRRSCLAALGLIVVAMAVITLSGPLMSAYMSDLHRASLAAPIFGQDFDPFRMIKLKQELQSRWFELLAPICFALWLGRSAHTEEERATGNRILLICMIATGGSIGLSWQNHENAMPSQIIAMAIVFAAMWSRQVRREQDMPLGSRTQAYGWSPVILASVIFTFIAGVSILNDGRGIILHTTKTALNMVQPAATLSPYLQGLTVPVDGKPGIIGDVLAGKIDPALYNEKSHTSWHNDVAAILDDGWRLFQAHKPAQPRIVTLYSAPLMTVTNGTTPPRHMAAWLDVERMVGPRSPIVPARDFVDVNVVMIFKIYDHDELFGMVQDYLKANFHIAGETPIWQMWVRNGG